MHNRAKEMLSYVPPYYQNSKLYRAQNDAKGIELDAIRWLIDDLENQINPRTATWSLPLWEDLCGFTPAANESIDDRRDKVFTLLVSSSPMTARTLAGQIKAAFGIDPVFSWTREPYVVDMLVDDFTESLDFGRVLKMAYDLLPAHLALLITVRYALTAWTNMNRARVQRLLISGLRVNSLGYVDILLDGSYLLDGSFPLRECTARGLDAHKLAMRLRVDEQHAFSVYSRVRAMLRNTLAADVKSLRISGISVNTFAFQQTFLDGSKKLDGTWMLGLFSPYGVDAHRLTASLAVSNPLKTDVCFRAPVSCRSNETANLTRSGAAMWLKNREAVRIPKTTMTASQRNVGAVAVYLTENTMWRLDGSYTLDGGRKLNADIIRSEM